jgi:multimeric flavodoxin WrbA
MKITVLCGSPRGKKSVTLKYVHYIGKEFPQHELEIFNISPGIKTIEKDKQAFQEILESIRSSDGILWASPVYAALVPSNYKRFIELIWEKGAANVFRDKHTVFLTTSVRFFDHTAQNYIHAVCDDLDMRYVGSFSARYDDLEKKEEKERMRLFAANFFDEIENHTLPPKSFMPLTWRDFDYVPGEPTKKIDVGNKKVLVLTDSQKHQVNLVRMIERFRASFSSEIEMINLWDIDIKGSCLGCYHCWTDNRCVYEGKDGYLDFYNTKVRPADIIIWAGAIKDRYLSSRWRLYRDRSFCTGAEPMGVKHFGFIISGPLSQAANTRQILEGLVENIPGNVGNPVGFVTDEYGDSATIDNSLQYLAGRLVRFAHTGYIQPCTFLGEGGMKVLKDAH